jgi:putative oxidoreductase
MTTAIIEADARGWRILLWVLQALLAALFVLSGATKLSAPPAELVARIGIALTKFIGVAELTGAAGLILPAMTRFRPHLTPLAAACLAIVMLFATAFHLAHGETPQAGFTVAVGGLALLIVWGRVRKAPIPER